MAKKVIDWGLLCYIFKKFIFWRPLANFGPFCTLPTCLASTQLMSFVLAKPHHYNDTKHFLLVPKRELLITSVAHRSRSTCKFRVMTVVRMCLNNAFQNKNVFIQGKCLQGIFFNIKKSLNYLVIPK